MSPVATQAACQGCLVNPPFRYPLFNPLYGPVYEPWPVPTYDQQPGVIPSQIHPPTELWEHEERPNYDQETLRKEFRERLYGTAEATLTEDEKQVLALLAQAWDKFNSLDKKCPSDNPEFLDSIHRAQQVVALRVARRANPEVWTQASEG